MENKKDSIVICPGAQVVGDVELGADVSIWHGAILRGDVDSIKIGNKSNVQDNCVVHCIFSLNSFAFLEEFGVGVVIASTFLLINPSALQESNIRRQIGRASCRERV